MQLGENLFSIIQPKLPRMDSTRPPCEFCKAECCYHTPVTRQELNNIIAYLNEHEGLVETLSAQERRYGMCPFVDTRNWTCAVYEARPNVCSLFGYTPDLKCSYAPELASRFPEACGQVMANLENKKEVTVLGDIYNWAEILEHRDA